VNDDEPFGHEPDDAPSPPDPFLPPELDAEPSSEDPDATERIDAPHLRRIPHRYRRSLGASAMAAGMLGLRDVLDEPKDDTPVVEQYVGEGDTERPIQVELDPDDPAASVVRLRHVDD
jgi:hypothetical protein